MSAALECWMDLDRFVASGRRIVGPTSDLIELHFEGDVWLALCHRPPFTRTDVVEQLLADARGFLEDPAVEGIVELDFWDPEGHRLVYPTERVWTLAEVLEGARQAGKPLGIRAGLELAYVGGLLLQDGAEAGAERGAPLHGDPNPWRIVFDDDADLHLIGWGLPPLSLYAADDDPELELPSDLLRYLPPERLRGDSEDLSSDLFALCLCAFEAITGQAAYPGNPREVRAMAERADIERRLYRFRDVIPESVRHFFGRALDPYRDARHDDVEDYLGEVHDLLYGPLTDELPSLADAVRAYGVEGPRLPRIPEKDAPRWRDPAASRQRWERPRRSGVHRRPTRTPESPPDAQALGARQDRGGPRSAAEALKARLTESRADREDTLRDRLGRSTARVPRAPVRDRNGLFPRDDLSGELLRFLVELPSGGTVWTRLSPDESLALSAARIADKACPTPVDATGRLTGWYRIEQGGAGWFGETRTSVLSADDPVKLAFVPNRVIGVELVLEGHEDAPAHLDVGTAVHAQFLISHLRQRFELRARDWVLQIEDDRPLDRWQILDDFDPDDGLVVHLRRRRGHRRSLRRR